MSTATAPLSLATETINPEGIRMGSFPARLRDWTPAHRRFAAKMGWQNRKDARIQAWRRFDSLLAGADPRAVRLYHCDLAEAALAVYAAHCPDDPRPATALWIARRYAEGLATDAERLGASTMLIALMHTFSDPSVPAIPRHPAPRALQVIGWALFRNPRRGLRYAMSWMSDELEAQVRDGGLAARLTTAE